MIFPSLILFTSSVVLLGKVLLGGCGFVHAIDDSLQEHHSQPNRGAFEGGPTSTKEDTEYNNLIQLEDQILGRKFDIPTGGPPSPLERSEVKPWTCRFMRFEEFGSIELPQEDLSDATLPIPSAVDAFPDPAALDLFLDMPIQPLPTESSNEHNLPNPWKDLIESYLGRELDNPPMEGRPTGSAWKHQRWDEFPPEKYFQTATTGARTNAGVRDHLQSHHYQVGEFGPGGLYADQTSGVEVRFHPKLPIQEPESMWGFDGTLPPKLAKSRYGEPLLMRHYNALPVDVTANRGFGVHTLTTHEHNGHNPAESDGYTNAFFFPGQFYDYRWPMILAGHDTINKDAEDRRAGAPDGSGGIKQIPGDWHETMSTHWFHDHMLDFTAANVYKGITAMINYYSALDRGNEGIDDGVNLRLPSGTDLDYGNRDYDINVLLADKAWDKEGQLWFNPHNKMGFIGDHLLTNWLKQPSLDVRARRYRFRLLNGSVSRFFKIALVTEKRGIWSPVPIYMVANDGNIMEHAVKFEDGILPTIGIAERYDIVVDFAGFKKGDTLFFVNLMQHTNGQGTDAIIPLTEVMDGSYQQSIYKSENEYGADPCVGQFMRMVVRQYSGDDLSMNPADYVEGKDTMIPILRPTEADLASATHRTFELERSPDSSTPWGIGTNAGEALPMDPHRVSAAVLQNHLEVWRLVNSGIWSHPYHIHFEEGVMIRKDGAEPPPHEKYARKDVFRMGPDEDSAVVLELAYRFRDFSATFMGHCHNTQHEDHAMLMRWDIREPGRVQLLPAPIPHWDGVEFEESFGVDTFLKGDGIGSVGPQLEPVKEWLRDITYGGFGEGGTQDLATVTIGDALNKGEDERGWVEIPLRKGIMKDHGDREVWFVLHDMSIKSLAEEFGVAYAGALHHIPGDALGEPATYDADTEEWEFYGDLPNPVGRDWAEGQSATNDYSPYRRIRIDGQLVIVNSFFVKWGEQSYEQLRIDETCSFPDYPANTNCMYNGHTWNVDTGHMLDIEINGENGRAKFKLHKSWSEGGSYCPYYIVVDSHPQGTANAMGIIWVPKHEFLSTTAVPLVQFIPGHKLDKSYPPTPSDEFGLMGGGPLGGQIGLPSYFMPGEDYSPAWHIGFAHWNHNATEVIKSLDRLLCLKDEEHLTIHEFPPVDLSATNVYDFLNPKPVHVVNCPTTITIDMLIHVARGFEDAYADSVRLSGQSGN